MFLLGVLGSRSRLVSLLFLQRRISLTGWLRRSVWLGIIGLRLFGIVIFEVDRLGFLVNPFSLLRRRRRIASAGGIRVHIIGAVLVLGRIRGS